MLHGRCGTITHSQPVGGKELCSQGCLDHCIPAASTCSKPQGLTLHLCTCPLLSSGSSPSSDVTLPPCRVLPSKLGSPSYAHTPPRPYRTDDLVYWFPWLHLPTTTPPSAPVPQTEVLCLCSLAFRQTHITRNGHQPSRNKTLSSFSR